MVARATTLEPWYIGSIFMLFLLGAASTKDFSDIKGDAAGGVRTLPRVLGSVIGVAGLPAPAPAQAPVPVTNPALSGSTSAQPISAMPVCHT